MMPLTFLLFIQGLCFPVKFLCMSNLGYNWLWVVSIPALDSICPGTEG